MNYQKKRQNLQNLWGAARDKEDWYEADVIRNTIAKANNTAKVDIRHAQGILDRLWESTYCVNLRKEINK